MRRLCTKSAAQSTSSAFLPNNLMAGLPFSAVAACNNSGCGGSIRPQLVLLPVMAIFRVTTGLAYVNGFYWCRSPEGRPLCATRDDVLGSSEL